MEEIYQNSLDLLYKSVDFELGSSSVPRSDEIHVNLACLWVCGSLLSSHLNQPQSLINIIWNHFSREPHFGLGFRESNQRLKLPGGGRNDVFAVPDSPHVHIGPYKLLFGSSRNLGLDILTSEADVFGQKLS